YVQTHFYPMDANDIAPIATVKIYAGGRVWYHMSYKIAYLILSSYENIRLKKWRKKYKLSKGKLLIKPDYTVHDKKFPVIYAISNVVFPVQSKWDDNIHVTGYFTSQKKLEYTPDPALVEFINKNEKVVYIGFGSMVADNLNRYMNIVIESLKETGVSAVITQGWGEIPDIEGENIYITKALPHDWLFKHVYAVVHHGGAGTFATGLRHGKPTLVIPFAGDQSFSAQRAYSLGIGPKPIDSEKLTTQKFSEKLLDLINNANYKINAEKIAVEVRKENGVVTAANIIEDYFNKA
ncbi:MAG: glycosyltransferase family 1 protein, partial [Christensenellaceae bacterium]|nr:glycosyltransferase family 1 protein [Christensenellaceae bacterium]